MEVESAPKNRVLVFARVCPASVQQPSCVQTLEESHTLHVHEHEASSAQEFVFDGVFSAKATQEEIFLKVGLPVVQDCLNGLNGTILAYGQTGSGKTHSLLHEGERLADSGLLQHVVDGIFDHIAQDFTSSYDVEVAAMQVYNEQIDDLLHPHGQNLAVTNTGEVPSLTWVPCKHAGELSRLVSRARTNLIYAETKMNKASSRSHAIFQIKLRRHGLSDVTFSKLSIVDLAGSERVKKSGADGMQFKEATAINKSLLAFGNVVSALAAKKRHVPFRDSKLTHVLSPCIGSNCKTSLLVCSSPAEEHVAETLCSLEFASRAMHVEVQARMNRMIRISSDSGIEFRPAVHHFDDPAMNVQEDELRNTKQALAGASARAEEAKAQQAVANEVTAQAVKRAMQAEARALQAEQLLRQWQERCDAASEEILSIKAALTAAESRAEAAEQVAYEWRLQCEEAMHRADSFEAELAELTAKFHLRPRKKSSSTASYKLRKDRNSAFEGPQEETQQAMASANEIRLHAMKLARASKSFPRARGKFSANHEAEHSEREQDQTFETVLDSWNQERDDFRKKWQKMVKARGNHEQRPAKHPESVVDLWYEFEQSLELEAHEMASKRRHRANWQQSRTDEEQSCLQSPDETQQPWKNLSRPNLALGRDSPMRFAGSRSRTPTPRACSGAHHIMRSASAMLHSPI